MTPIITFEEAYVERMWGGTRLRTVYEKPTPSDRPVGEAWLIADHAEHESVIHNGPFKGRTLRELLREDAPAVLGSRAALTVHGRFPLLLKLLDAGDKLSVQVHPDDAAAAQLGEPDVGKTEMWYVIEGEPDSLLYCGFPPNVTREDFESARADGRVASLLSTIQARPGTAVFVPAGTVHAIGGGCLLAEIQQNSDLTYRIDDWGRTQADGSPRQLHLDKALGVTHFGSRHAGPAHPLTFDRPDVRVHVLAACRYFAAERIDVTGTTTFDTRGESFQLCLGLENTLRVSSADAAVDLKPGSALMITGSADRFSVRGPGSLLRYYVPDLQRDIVEPLSGAGHADEAIVALGGDAATSDLSGVVGAHSRDR